ncbi:hypothetical protein EDB86DRAFT_2794439 [Lactarius hatsudake]|nr:hypothetical protein EDB86DRAFT_2794439 [Lactarius hatsudake]
MDHEYNHLDQVLPGLWVGDLHSAKDADTLKANNIHSILTVMRGKVSIPETFIRHQIPLDDVAETDVLQHLIPAITFIQAELDKDRGILVHCQAGASRSATVAAAYVMYSQNIDASAAIDLIRKVRPNINPNAGFIAQLEIFHQASFKVSRRDKATRMFYLERAVEEVLNGDGTPETDMFAKFPRTPTDSAPATPGGPRRRIRCKMCRTELANREHMLDHGQLGPPTPAVALSPVSSRRPSTHDAVARRPSSSSSRRPSGGALSMTAMPRPRLGSTSGLTRPFPLTSLEGSNGLAGQVGSLSMSALEDDEIKSPGQECDPLTSLTSQSQSKRTSSFGTDLRTRLLAGLSTGIPSSLSMSALDSDDEEAADSTSATVPTPITSGINNTDTAPSSLATETIIENTDSALSTNKSRLPLTLSTSAAAGVSTLQHGADLAVQLHSNPKLAALRSPGGLTMTPLQTSTRVVDKASISPPILMNPKCSGYFVEPMKWMEFFLEDGQLAGKIICPNKKCGVKLGNYDWAGVCCSCKEWVVPGFCIHRSKVDEIV